MKFAALFVLALFATACTSAEKESTAEAPPQYFQVDTGTAAKLDGTVRFAGKKAPARRISMNAEEACEALHDGPVVDPGLITNRSGGVANVLVYIKAGLEGKRFEPPSEAVILDQRGCMFVPRVIALRTGQTLSVKNSDPVSHNVHPMPQANREWNQHQAPDAPDLKRKFARPEMLIPVKCNVHSWMRSYISVLEHPYFAISDENGRFAFPDLPPGKYTVGVWHELLGEKEALVDLGPKAEQTMQLVFE